MKDSTSAEPQAPESSPPGRPPAGGFRAHLQGIGLHDLVMLQNLVRASGVFVVLSGDRTGTLNFSRGQLLHAETGELLGDAAAIEILSWREGEFINSERTSPERTTVSSSLESLLLRLAKDIDDAQPFDPPLTTSTGVRRRMDEPSSFRTTHRGLGVPSAPTVARGLAAAATPGVAALTPKAPLRAPEPRSGVTSVLISPQGSVIDGNGSDPTTLGSKAAYMAKLTDLISQAIGAGDTRSIKVRHPGSELLVRRHADGHIAATLGPVDPNADTPPASSPLPPPARFT